MFKTFVTSVIYHDQLDKPSLQFIERLCSC